MTRLLFLTCVLSAGCLITAHDGNADRVIDNLLQRMETMEDMNQVLLEKVEAVEKKNEDLETKVHKLETFSEFQ